MAKTNARFIIKKSLPDRLIIEDIGPHWQRLTVTNDAEHVVKLLHDWQMLGTRRLFYKDTDGMMCELKHDGNGKLTGFGLGE